MKDMFSIGSYSMLNHFMEIKKSWPFKKVEKHLREEICVALIIV